jgi:hypothetical protein
VCEFTAHIRPQFNAGQLQILYRIVKQDAYGYMSSTDFLEACTFMLLCEALFRKADAVS